MEFIAINYKDPMFSLLVVLVLVVLIFLANKWLESYKSLRQKKRISAFIKRFELIKKDDEYQNFFDDETKTEYLILLASLKSRSGLYEEAIRIYLGLLDLVLIKESKIEIMTLLGQTYFKAGFLQRAMNILLETLKLKSRNQKALEILLIVYEQLKNYQAAIDVCESLNEMNQDTSKQLAILNALIIINDAKLTNEKKTKILLSQAQNIGAPRRLIAEFLAVFSVDDFWANLDPGEILDQIDLLWEIPKEEINKEKIKNNKLLQEIYSAKGYVNTVNSSDIFALDILLNLQDKTKADLEFEYICKECNTSFPLSFYRCPVCQNLHSLSIQTSLSEKNSNNSGSANFY